MDDTRFSQIQNELDQRGILTDIKNENGKYEVIVNFEIVSAYHHYDNAQDHIKQIYHNLEK